MMDKKNILLLSYSPLKSDPRVKRQIVALRNDYTIYTAGYNASEEELPFTQLNYSSNKPNFTFHLRYPTLIRKFFSFFILFRCSVFHLLMCGLCLQKMLLALSITNSSYPLLTLRKCSGKYLQRNWRRKIRSWICVCIYRLSVEHRLRFTILLYLLPILR